MKKINFNKGNILLANMVLLVATVSISQCCYIFMYQPQVDANLKTQLHQAKNKAKLKKE